MVRVCIIGALAVSMAGVGCIRLPDDKPQKDRGAIAEVKLPPRPNLTAKPQAEKFQDGAYTVAGFIRHARSLVGTEVTLRGFVRSIESCKEGEKICGTVPHLTLVDNLTGSRRRVLVVSDIRDEILEGFPVQSNQTFKGRVALWSPDGRLVDLDGILVIPPKPEVEEGEGTEEAK